MWDIYDSNNLLLLIHANYGLVSCVVPFLNCSYTCRGRNWRRVQKIADALCRRTPKSCDYFVSLAKLPSWCSAVYYGMYKGLRKHHIWNASSLSSRLWSLSTFLRRTGAQAEHITVSNRFSSLQSNKPVSTSACGHTLNIAFVCHILSSVIK